jgi:hypothetical protein
MLRTVVPFLLFALLTLQVGLSSVFDAYLNLKYPVTADTEENPLAGLFFQFISNQDHARAALLCAKFAGTLLTVVILLALFHFQRTRSWAWIIVCALVLTHGLVLLYMTDGLRFV